MATDATHDPALRSWVSTANDGRTDFPVQNLPHAVFRRRGCGEAWRGGVGIGDQVLDLAAAAAAGVFAPHAQAAVQAAAADTLNGLMALGRPAWRGLRAELSRLLRHDAAERERLAGCLVPQAQVEHALPARIGNYTDGFTSWHHMVNAGRIFRPDAPPLPQFKWLPMAYHGRASSVAVSGAPVIRPQGQRAVPGAAVPHFGPCEQLDYELELAAWIGPGNARGRRIRIGEAADHVFGLSLFNDWSARDVQAWESLPLGPFLAKNFLSTVGPWIVTMEALEPFRCALPRTPDDPPHLPHLRDPQPHAGYDLQLEVWLRGAPDTIATRLSRSSFRHAYWSLAQMLAHHTAGGCNLCPGDLVATGTQSGPGESEAGCLLERSHAGRRPVSLDAGGTRSWLEDGDTLTLHAWAEKAGAVRLGFGPCVGVVTAATPVGADG